jgi:hypothetical protein
MVEYYKTSGGYFYKINKKGEVTRVSNEVYKKNVMKGGSGAGGGGGGEGGGGGGEGGNISNTGFFLMNERPRLVNKNSDNYYETVIDKIKKGTSIIEKIQLFFMYKNINPNKKLEIIKKNLMNSL